jgi:hypothetical protein
MSADPRGERLQIMLTLEELGALDQWRFSRHVPSRADGDSRAVAAWFGGGRLRHYGRKDEIRRFRRDRRYQAEGLKQRLCGSDRSPISWIRTQRFSPSRFQATMRRQT